MAKTNRRDDSAQVRSKMKQVSRHKARQRRWWLVGSVLGLVVLIIGLFLYISHLSEDNGITPSDPAVFNAVTHVNPALLAQVGTGNAQSSLHPVKGSPILLGPTGKPEFFYVGGEFCPYCAAQRWAIVVALSRFGTFSPLSQIRSSEQNLATFTFRDSTYKSSYVDFVPVEIKDNQENPLQKLSSQQEQIFQTYDAPPYVEQGSGGTIPFIDIANQYVSTGSYYLPDWLVGLSWQDVATQIKQPDTNVSKGILGSANYLTAALCASTQNKPATVCSADYIQQIERFLPTSSALVGEVRRQG